VRTVWHVLGFALLFWLVAVFVLGAIVFLVPTPQSDEPASDAWGLLFVLALVVGGIYGWYRSRRG
jgi:hypothetical protein